MPRMARCLAVFVLFAASLAHASAARPAALPAHSLIDADLYILDTPHSSVEFAVPWMGLTKVKGTFTDVRGTLAFDANDLARSSLTVIINMPSITTGNAQRDKDLKGESFFDVAKYPTARFTSRAITQEGDAWRIRGALTIKAVTQDIDVPFSFLGQEIDSGGTARRVGFEGATRISRRGFGVEGNPRLNRLTTLGQQMIGDEVDLELAIQCWMPTPARVPGAGDSLYRAILDRGVAAVANDYRALRSHTPDSLMAVNEAVLNNTGYFLLRENHPREALAIFQLEQVAYPAAAFAWTGLGQTYATLGDREHAIGSYEKAVALDPLATRPIEMLRRLRPVAAASGP